MNDESAILTQFISITGAEAEVARQYLQASNWEFSTAVDRFYTNPPPSEGNQPLLGQEPAVRAPIAATFDTLVGAPTQPLSWMSSFYQEQPRQSRDWGANWQNKGSSKSSLLADLYKAPDYKFTGTLQEACRKAEEENKAVLVNIQSIQTFDSHILNRDVWKDAVIEQMIHHNFILCQWDVDDPEGKKYVRFYNCYDYPHLAILNPTIRKEVVIFSEKRKKLQVQEVLLGYLEQETLTKKQPVPDSSEENPSSIRIPEPLSSGASNEQNILQAAIQASLADYKEEVPHVQKKISKEDKLTSTAVEINQMETIPSIPSEPELSDQTTNLRVQLPDGSKLLRRFHLDSKTQLIYDWCASVCKSRDFKLSIRFPKKVLGEDDFSKTLRELGFRNIQLFLTKGE